MDAKHWTGADDRDVCDPAEEPPCADCGALADEPCDPRCNCDRCIAKRDPRTAA